MSAFIVTDNHIHSILYFARRHALGRVYFGRKDFDLRDHEACTYLGQMLVDANYASVNFRYREDDGPHIYVFKAPTRELTPVECLKALDCLDYQCCEVDNYRDTDAAKLIESIRSIATQALSGYEAAAWAIK